VAKYLKERSEKAFTKLFYAEPEFYRRRTAWPSVEFTEFNRQMEAATKVVFPPVKIIIDETYTSKKTTYAKILEVKADAIIAKVLLNEEKRTFQKRQFDKAPFADMNLSVNDFVKITIYTKPGERKFVYSKINHPLIKKKFERKTYFKGLEDSKFFNPLPSENEDKL